MNKQSVSSALHQFRHLTQTKNQSALTEAADTFKNNALSLNQNQGGLEEHHVNMVAFQIQSGASPQKLLDESISMANSFNGKTFTSMHGNLRTWNVISEALRSTFEQQAS